MKWLLITLLLGVTHNLLAQEIDPTKDTLSAKWTAGAFLIYDCDDRHWVCVHDLGQAQCEDLRKNKLASGARTLGCAPGQVFESREACWDVQKRLVNEALYPRTCLHPNARKRFIGFR
jgi:hypothetical protein